MLADNPFGLPFRSAFSAFIRSRRFFRVARISMENAANWAKILPTSSGTNLEASDGATAAGEALDPAVFICLADFSHVSREWPAGNGRTHAGCQFTRRLHVSGGRD